MTNRRDKITAALLTALVALVVLLLLLFTALKSAAHEQPQPPQQDEIFYEVMELPEPEAVVKHDTSTPLESSGLDVDDAGKSDAAPNPLATNAQQPDNTQVQKPEDAGNPGADSDAPAEQPKRRPGANLPTGGSFAGTTEGKPDSNGSSPYAIPGRSIKATPHTVIRTKSAQSGWVDVDITVTPQGKVVAAEVIGTSGFGAEEDEIRNKAKALLLTELSYTADNKVTKNLKYTKRVTISPAK